MTRNVEDEELFAKLYVRLRRFAAVVRPPSLEAEDLVQEALARTLAARTLTSLDNPEAYLRRAIVRVAMNEQRGSRRLSARIVRLGPLPANSVDPYPSDLSELMRLSPEVRAVLYLHLVEDLPYEEVSAILGCRPAAVRQRASRGLASLRLAIEVNVEEVR